MPEKKMTDKQRAFVSGLLKGKNQTQAAIDAGYSKNRARQTGAEPVTNRDISRARARYASERDERLGLDEDWTLRNAIDGYKASIAAEDFKAARGFLDLIAKMRGEMAPKEIKHTFAQGFSDELERAKNAE